MVPGVVSFLSAIWSERDNVYCNNRSKFCLEFFNIITKWLYFILYTDDIIFEHSIL